MLAVVHYFVPMGLKPIEKKRILSAAPSLFEISKAF
jgi:hypothetical protein